VAVVTSPPPSNLTDDTGDRSTGAGSGVKTMIAARSITTQLTTTGARNASQVDFIVG
jgi:hypothetical protein